MKEKLKIQKGSRGITLIALVITIIVLLILAAVSIATLTGENGILTKANGAKSETAIGEEKEQISLAYSAVMANKIKEKDDSEVTATELQGELNNLNANATATPDNNKIKVTFNKTGNVYTIDSEGRIEGPTTSGDNGGTTQKTVADLVAGEYVNYIYEDEEGNEITIPCIVLYDEAYNTQHNTDYGIQVITADTVKDADGNEVKVELGNGTGSSDRSTDPTHFETAKESYNNAIKTLNDEAEKYLNDDFANDARCAGSVPSPNQKNSESGMFTKDTTTETNYAYLDTYGWNGEFRDGDDPNGEVDLIQMNALNIPNLDKNYWVACRLAIGEANANCYFLVLFGSGGGTVYDLYLCNVNNDGSSYSRSFECAFRPVFHLKSNIKITGLGTEESPYELEV